MFKCRKYIVKEIKGALIPHNRAFSCDVTILEVAILMHKRCTRKMVLCAVVGCSNRSGRDKGVSFFSIPKVITCRSQRVLELSKNRRDGYLAAISREDITDRGIVNIRVCSQHFISGEPASLFDELNPDWLPTQNLGHTKVDQDHVLVGEGCYQRSKVRAERRWAVATHETKPEEMDTEVAEKFVDSEVQTEMCGREITLLRQELNVAHEQIRVLECKIAECQPFTETFLHDDECVQFYTGLPNLKVLKTVFEFVAAAQQSSCTKLTSFQEFMVVMVKLCLNLSTRDIAHSFQVSKSTISRIRLKWITLMDVWLQPLIKWTEREDLHRTMPESFRTSFGNKSGSDH